MTIVQPSPSKDKMKIREFSDGYLGIHTQREDIRQRVATIPGVVWAEFTETFKRNYLVVRPSALVDRSELIHAISVTISDGLQ